MRLRFILPELEAFIRLNPARYRADIHNDELNFPRSEQAISRLATPAEESTPLQTAHTQRILEHEFTLFIVIPAEVQRLLSAHYFNSYLPTVAFFPCFLDGRFRN
jgi:hypothetical protein